MLLTHPAVAAAAVIGVPDEIYGEAVAAYLELEPGAAVSEDEIVAHCRRHRASYKKPKHVRVVAELPRNSKTFTSGISHRGYSTDSLAAILRPSMWTI